MTQEGEKRIINKIVQMAEAEADKIMSEAQLKAQEIRKDAELRADSEAQDIINHGAQEAKREKQRIIAEARLKAKRKKMAMQEHLMQASFELALKDLQALSIKGEVGRYRYDTIITNLIREAAEIIGDTSLQLSFNEKDKKRFQPLLSQISQNLSQALGKKITLSLSDKTISTIGGVSVKSKKGTVGVDNTIEARTGRFNETLKAGVNKILF